MPNSKLSNDLLQVIDSRLLQHGLIDDEDLDEPIDGGDQEPPVDLMDSFERESLEYYGGETGAFEISSDAATDGERSLYTENATWATIFARDDDGLPHYPQPGDTVSIDFFGRGNFGFELNLGHSGPGNRFLVAVRREETYSSLRDDGDVRDVNYDSVSTPEGEWCRLTIEWVSRSEVTYTVTNRDGEELYSGGGSFDAEMLDTGQFAIIASNSPGGEVWLDYLRLGEDSVGRGSGSTTPDDEGNEDPSDGDSVNSSGTPVPNADAPWGFYEGDVPDMDWSLDAADDFDGTLEESNWQAGFGWGGRSHGSTEEYCRDEDVWVSSDNHLVMQTLPDPGAPQGWYGGAANTLGEVEGTYGYWEACLKLPEPVSGFIPGFWARGADDLSGSTGWPPEVDFMERFGEYPDGETTAHTVHYDDPRKEDSIRQDHGITLSDEFHVFGCLWTEDSCQFFLDGQLIEDDGKTETTSEAHGTDEYFLESQDHYAILTNHVWLSSWNGEPDENADYPCFTEMAWFRRWTF